MYSHNSYSHFATPCYIIICHIIVVLIALVTNVICYIDQTDVKLNFYLILFYNTYNTITCTLTFTITSGLTKLTNFFNWLWKYKFKAESSLMK